MRYAKDIVPYILCAASLIILIAFMVDQRDTRHTEQQLSDARYRQQEETIQILTDALQRESRQRQELELIILGIQTQLEEMRFKPNSDILLDATLQEHTYNLCRQNGVPYDVMLAIMWHESGYQTDVIGHNRNGTYDIGLCQINSVNHSWLMEKHQLDVSDPYDNIEAAVVILGQFLDKYPLEQALACYAAGERGAIELGRGMWFAERILDTQGN